MCKWINVKLSEINALLFYIKFQWCHSNYLRVWFIIHDLWTLYKRREPWNTGATDTILQWYIWVVVEEYQAHLFVGTRATLGRIPWSLVMVRLIIKWWHIGYISHKGGTYIWLLIIKTPNSSPSQAHYQIPISWLIWPCYSGTPQYVVSTYKHNFLTGCCKWGRAIESALYTYKRNLLAICCRVAAVQYKTVSLELKERGSGPLPQSQSKHISWCIIQRYCIYWWFSARKMWLHCYLELRLSCINPQD